MPADEQRVLKLERALLRTQALLVLVAAAGSIAIWWVHSLPARELRSGRVVIADDRITIADRVRLDTDGLAVKSELGKMALSSASLSLESSAATKTDIVIVPDSIILHSPDGSVDLTGDHLRIGTPAETFDVTLLPPPSRAAVLSLTSGVGVNDGSSIRLDAGAYPIASGSCSSKKCDWVWSLGNPDRDHINDSRTLPH